jgi:hypothetical protein
MLLYCVDANKKPCLQTSNERAFPGKRFYFVHSTSFLRSYNNDFLTTLQIERS